MKTFQSNFWQAITVKEIFKKLFSARSYRDALELDGIKKSRMQYVHFKGLRKVSSSPISRRKLRQPDVETPVRERQTVLASFFSKLVPNPVAIRKLTGAVGKPGHAISGNFRFSAFLRRGTAGLRSVVFQLFFVLRLRIRLL